MIIRRLGREVALRGLRPRARRRDDRAGRPVRRRRPRRAPAPARRRRGGELLRLRRADRRRGRGGSVRVSRLQPALVPEFGHAAARARAEAGPRAARARPRRGAQPHHEAAVRQGPRPAQRGAARQRPGASVDSVLENFERADRLLLLTSRAFEYETFSPPPNARVVGPAARRPGLGGRLVAAAGRRAARARGDELHLHGPRRRAPARDHRAGRAAGARPRHHRPARSRSSRSTRPPT